MLLFVFVLIIFCFSFFSFSFAKPSVLPTKQVRSASFDEIKLEAQRTAQLLAAAAAATQAETDNSSGLLQVPQNHSGQRSRSFDSAGIQQDEASNSFLDVPRRFQRRRSSSKTPPLCVHCMYLEEYKKRVGVSERVYFDQVEVRSYESDETPTSSDDDDDDDTSSGEPEKLYANQNTLLPPPSPHHHGIVFTLSPTSNEPPALFPVEEQAGGSPPPASPSSPTGAGAMMYPPSPTIELPPGCDELPNRTRRRSISRQEAIFVEPTGNSLENVSASEKEKSSGDTELEKVQSDPCVDCVSDIYLAVPDLKRDRAASVDSCFSKVSQAKTEELKPPEDGLTLMVPSNGALRSRSVDIVLPTDQQKRYKALALTQVMANIR